MQINKLKNMNNEIWKDVVGYENYYQVSSFGNVKSKERICNHFKGGKSIRKEKLLKQWERNGYCKVALYNYDTKIKTTFSVHRLVAIHFFWITTKESHL